jgi:hypothetical protein
MKCQTGLVSNLSYQSQPHSAISLAFSFADVQCWRRSSNMEVFAKVRELVSGFISEGWFCWFNICWIDRDRLATLQSK